MLVMTIESRHIGGCATHIESNDRGLLYRVPASGCKSNNTSSWPRQDRFQATEFSEVDQSTIGLHEFEPTCSLVLQTTCEARRDGIDVGFDDGCQVGIGRGGHASGNDLDHGLQFGR